MEEHAKLSLRFPRGSHAVDCTHSAVELPCVLEFSSTQPLSKTDYITFSDVHTGRRYRYIVIQSRVRCTQIGYRPKSSMKVCSMLFQVCSYHVYSTPPYANSIFSSNSRKRVPFTVAADNSMFTIYMFLAQNVNTSSISASEHSPVPKMQLLQTSRQPQGTSSTSTLSVNSTSSTNTVHVPAPSSLSGSVLFGDIYLQVCQYSRLLTVPLYRISRVMVWCRVP